MTRKRKVDNTQSEDSTEDKKPQFSGYGYQPTPSEGPSGKGESTDMQQSGEPRRTFPHKDRGGGGFRGRGGPRGRQFSRGGRGRGYDGGDFVRKYGRVGDSADGTETEEHTYEESKGRDEKEAYPAELVAYLKNIEQLRETEGQIERMVLDKCAEECAPEVEKLLLFRDSCIVVESVFGSSAYGAELFLSALARLKHKRLLELLFSGTSSRAIETLFYALVPIKESTTLELLEKFSDLLCDNWNDAVTCQFSAFLIRCFARVACGLRKKDKNALEDSSCVQTVQNQNADVKIGVSRVFDRIASLALESAASPRVENVHLSLVVQDVLEADATAKLGKSSALVEKILTSTSESDLRQLWLGKNSSRVWEKLVLTCREETLQSLWEAVITGHVAELAAHPCANFPLQKFMACVKSLELATDVCHEATPLIQKFLSSDRWGVAQALLRCAARHEELQEPLLKELRQYFRASKVTNKLNFLLNVVTLNKYNGKTFNVNDAHLHGCLILEVLLSFHKVKTLTACLEALPESDVVQLAKNRCGSHVLQSAFRSNTLSEDLKEKLIKAFEVIKMEQCQVEKDEHFWHLLLFAFNQGSSAAKALEPWLIDDWGSLISDVYGSHVFESIWECSLFDVKRRQELMKKLVPIRSDTKFWKFAMLRCDMYLFRKDRKAWVEKMKKSVKGAKH